MNITEYTTRNAEINDSIRALKDKKGRLRNAYISANAEFKIGDKVEVSFKNGIKKEAIIGNIKVGFNNKVSYVFMKVKKDGTASQHTHHFYIYESVKLL